MSCVKRKLSNENSEIKRRKKRNAKRELMESPFYFQQLEKVYTVNEIANIRVIFESSHQQMQFNTFSSIFGTLGFHAPSLDSMPSERNAVVCRQLTRAGQIGSLSYRIRAKPLNPIHENSLQRFLSAQRWLIQFMTILETINNIFCNCSTHHWFTGKCSPYQT